eukprot:COSAG02_NODE_10552_length_1915_cov_5.038546_1_plen_150_part_00
MCTGLYEIRTIGPSIVCSILCSQCVWQHHPTVSAWNVVVTHMAGTMRGMVREPWANVSHVLNRNTHTTDLHHQPTASTPAQAGGGVIGAGQSRGWTPLRSRCSTSSGISAGESRGWTPLRSRCSTSSEATIRYWYCTVRVRYGTNTVWY